MQLFVDMDGVLADFDRGFFEKFGRKKSERGPAEDKDWADVRGTEGFYANLPPMPDMQKLWDHLYRHKPVVLTGVPLSVPESAENKRAWVRKNLGSRVITICCPSKDKSKWCFANDVLIDDWERYKSLWVKAGGVWITHVNAEQTIEALRGMDL